MSGCVHGVRALFGNADLLVCVLARVQARLPEIDELAKQLHASREEVSDVRFQLEEDKATASAAQVGC